MKVFVVVAKVDGIIQGVFVHKSKKKAIKQRTILIESIGGTIKSECSGMDNKNNAGNVLKLRLDNSSVSMYECPVENGVR